MLKTVPIPNYAIESGFSGIVAGVDEAGRGPWAGPVVAAAAILHENCIPQGINDSKKLTPSAREQLYVAIVANCHIGVGMASVQEIDTHNILGATKLAMRRAVKQLSVTPHIALVDGNQAPKLPCKVHTVINGDALSLSIAAASIVAKVTRDRIMRELALEHPGYGWHHNAGYGTQFHQQALARLGVTPHHRRSFKPIQLLLETTANAA